MNRKWPRIIGCDCDPQAVAAARKNVLRAGLASLIEIRQAELASLAPPPTDPGMLLVNPPYGERLSEKELVVQLYRAYGRILRRRFSGWKTGVLLANPEMTDSFGLSWQKKFRLYNGPIPCRFVVGEVPPEGQEFQWRPNPAKDAGPENDFANRLRKNLKNTLKWASREKVCCFRLYDRDLPDYNLSVDLYGKWVHVQEYAPPKSIDPQVAQERFALAVRTLKDVLGIRSDRLFLKTRERQKGKRQYQKRGDRGRMYEVREGDCCFLVNFTDYLDTGLFLDHRPVRERIHHLARGRRFLNLFGYTGTATVHAAMGGAASTMTVDLSATYLQWARMNLSANGFCEISHRVEQADCLAWLAGCRSTFDLIFVDPPTFSNTRKEKRVFDVQRDHGVLIEKAMSRLSREGLLIFSTNYRQFRLDGALAGLYGVDDISRESLPYDFSRNRRIHQCWEIRHRS